MPTLSVIIPTHKRPEILRECLKRIESQTIAHQLEVIVVSDGPDADTKHVISEVRSPKSEVRFFEIPKSQQGVARNKGVEEAMGERVLFIGDDIFLDRHACEKHAEGVGAMLGYTTWDPAVDINNVMVWLEESGWQFGYPLIAPYAHTVIPAHMQPRFTYTSHISLPTVIAKQIPFLSDVTMYGWEDMEWGRRLMKERISLLYEPDAKALHHHHITLEQSLQRMETLGKSAVVIEKIAPELNVVPKGWKRMAYQFAAMLPTMDGRHRKAFLSGIKKG